MDNTFLLFILPTVGGILLYSLTKMSVLSKGRNLQASFRGLGQIAGKTRVDIVQAVGPPNSISSLAGDKTILQWISPGDHIALRFKGQAEDSICEGVTHETAVG
jgi:hypothetical protein